MTKLRPELLAALEQLVTEPCGIVVVRVEQSPRIVVAARNERDGERLAQWLLSDFPSAAVIAVGASADTGVNTVLDLDADDEHDVSDQHEDEDRPE